MNSSPELAFPPDVVRRIHMTVSCGDSASIPKVAGAGEIFEENGVRYQRMHNGLKVVEHGYHGPAMTEIIRRLSGHHEPQEERVFHELLKQLSPGATMLELGSHWSYYSLWFHAAIRDARNFMIEPDPWNFELGQRNFKLNGFQGEFLNAFIGETAAPPMPFHCEYDQKMRDIARVCVDDFVAERKIARVDLLLCDIQGYELQMLRGARKSIREGKIRFAVISTHHHAISDDPLTHQRCLDFLKAEGAHILAAHGVSESFSGDGLIAVAFLPEDKHLPEIPISRNWASNSLFRELEYDLQDLRDQRADLTRQNHERETELNRLRGEVARLHAENSQLHAALRHAQASLPNRVLGKAGRLLRRAAGRS